jgi:hypothetical protein
MGDVAMAGCSFKSKVSERRGVAHNGQIGEKKVQLIAARGGFTTEFAESTAEKNEKSGFSLWTP